MTPEPETPLDLELQQTVAAVYAAIASGSIAVDSMIFIRVLEVLGCEDRAVVWTFVTSPN